jgi:hypothetical protein
MRTARYSTELMNLDVLALSLLCCLLASVVGVLVLGGEPGPKVAAESEKDKPESNENDPLVWAALQEQTAKLYAHLQEVERSRETITSKLNYSILERQNIELKSRIKEIEDKLDLIGKINAVKLEIERLSQELDEQAEKLDVHLTPQARRMLGEYKGPYVLIECIENGAIVYPGKQRIEMSPSNEQADQLVKQIANTGFVAFVVRPNGWYDNSYDKLQTIIYHRLDQFEKNTGKYVGRSAFPITSGDSITNYIPPEAKQ